jgi:hypothetical protein
MKKPQFTSTSAFLHASRSRLLPLLLAACALGLQANAQTTSSTTDSTASNSTVNPPASDTTGTTVADTTTTPPADTTTPPADTTSTGTSTTASGTNTDGTGTVAAGGNTATTPTDTSTTPPADTTTGGGTATGSTTDTTTAGTGTTGTTGGTTTGTSTDTTTGTTGSGTTTSTDTTGTASGSTTGTDTTTSTGTTGGSTTTTTSTDTTTTIVPAITTLHADAVLMAAGGTATSTYQWRLNGTVLTGETNPMLSVAKVASANTGIYSVDITDGTATKTANTILGYSPVDKIVGDAAEVGTDIVHQNGNVYDQVLMTGPAATVKADANQITRVSFVDVDDDIVQVEFAGAGSLTISLANATAPAPAANYNQPNVNYVKGNATIVVNDADESTYLSVFSVGKNTAVNQALFKDGVAYGGFANIATIAVLSANGKFGGLALGDTNFIGTQGFTGVYAPGINFTNTVTIGDITADGTAIPAILLGGSTQVRIAGGDLYQANHAAVQVSGFTALPFVLGASSQGTAVHPAIAGQLMEAGVDVTSRATLQ